DRLWEHRPMKLTQFLPLALALTACAAQDASSSGGKTAAKVDEPKVAQQQLKNLGEFDVGLFSLEPPAIPPRVNNDVLSAILYAARPNILECLVDPQHRGADKHTKIVIDATLTDAGVDSKVTGQNLTPEGTACIEGALKKWTQAASTLNAKAA